MESAWLKYLGVFYETPFMVLRIVNLSIIIYLQWKGRASQGFKEFLQYKQYSHAIDPEQGGPDLSEKIIEQMNQPNFKKVIAESVAHFRAFSVDTSFI